MWVCVTHEWRPSSTRRPVGREGKVTRRAFYPPPPHPLLGRNIGKEQLCNMSVQLAILKCLCRAEGEGKKEGSGKKWGTKGNIHPPCEKRGRHGSPGMHVARTRPSQVYTSDWYPKGKRRETIRFTYILENIFTLGEFFLNDSQFTECNSIGSTVPDESPLRF